eukprot:scaffold105393_cov60-Phaeocystis_antarctica.AAC.1
MFQPVSTAGGRGPATRDLHLAPARARTPDRGPTDIFSHTHTLGGGLTSGRGQKAVVNTLLCKYEIPGVSIYFTYHSIYLGRAARVFRVH